MALLAEAACSATLTDRCLFVPQMPQQLAVPPAPAPKQPSAGRSSRSRGSTAEQQASAAEPSEAESAAQPAEEDAARGGGDDGILELQPHYQYISGLRCAAMLNEEY